MEHHDVIIIGGGPAGAACARALTGEGMDVLVIEKQEMPRHKTCSGILFGQTQVLLEKYFGGFPPEEVYCRPRIIPASGIHEWSRKKGFVPYVWEIEKDGRSFPVEYHNIWRNLFDHWLLEQSGAPSRRNCVLRDFTTGADKTVVTVFDKNENAEQQMSCSFLIGADGVNSQVRKILDPGWVGRSTIVHIFQAYYECKDVGGLADSHWTVFFEPSIGDIISSAHCKDNSLTLCVGGFQGRKLRRSMKEFKAFLADMFNVVLGDELRSEGCTMRVAPPDLGRGNVLLTGDAVGLMYLNGEGISAAIDSGFQAGLTVAEAMQSGDAVLDLYGQKAADILRHMETCLSRIHFFTTKPPA